MEVNGAHQLVPIVLKNILFLGGVSL